MTQMKQVAQRILGMQGQAQLQAIEKMRGAGMGPWDFPVLAASTGPRVAPLTPAQQEMYATQVGAPDDSRFHLYSSYTMDAGFDLARLRSVMARLVERHGALRTRFVHQNGSLVQEMVDGAHVDLDERIAWSRSDDQTEAWIQACIQRPFDLTKAGLWRIEARPGPQGGLVTVVFHHLIMDAWSMQKLVQELGKLMSGQKLDQLSEDAPTQFVDYAAWAALWHSPSREAAQAKFWTEYLNDARLGWRAGNRDAPRRWGQGKKFQCVWPSELSDALHQRATQLGCTPFLLLLNGFYDFLGSIDASAPWVVASTRADRPSACLESSIGYYVKTCVTKSPTGQNLDDKLRGLVNDWRQVSANQELSFGRILGALGGAAKVPAILFVQHPRTEPSAKEGQARATSTHRAFARFAWSLRVDATPGAQLRIGCEFDSLCFDEASMRAGMRSWQDAMFAWLVQGKLLPSTQSAARAELRASLARVAQGLFNACVPADSTPSQGLSDASGLVPSNDRLGVIEDRLCEIWASVLGHGKVQPSDNFFALGGDSISSLQVVSRALRQGWELKAQDLVTAPTLADLAKRVRHTTTQRLAAGTISWTKHPQLSSAQQWFFGLDLASPEYFNQSQFLVTRAGLDMKTIVSSLGQLVIAHEALRTAFVQEHGHWQARPCDLCKETLIDFLTPRVHYVNQSKLSESAAETQVLERSQAAMRAHDFETGGLFQVVYFDRGFGKEGRLLVVLHHLITDGVSWRLLLSQWEELVAEQATLPAQPSPFALVGPGQAPGLGGQAAKLRMDEPGQAGQSAWVAQRILKLELCALQDSEVKGRSHALLSAWVQAVAEQQASECLVVDIERHGRTQEASALCVGWMTQRVSLVFQTPSDGAKNRAFLDAGTSDAPAWSGVSLCFNDHGQVRVDLPELSGGAAKGLWARPLRAGQEAVAASRDPQDRRPYLWTLNCFHHERQVHLHWLYDPRKHQASTIEAIMQRMRELLVQDKGAASVGENARDASGRDLAEASSAKADEMQQILEALNQ